MEVTWSCFPPPPPRSRYSRTSDRRPGTLRSEGLDCRRASDSVVLGATADGSRRQAGVASATTGGRRAWIGKETGASQRSKSKEGGGTERGGRHLDKQWDEPWTNEQDVVRNGSGVAGSWCPVVVGKVRHWHRTADILMGPSPTLVG
jgi:hypothetical protein